MLPLVSLLLSCSIGLPADVEPPPPFDWKAVPANQPIDGDYLNSIIIYADEAPKRCRARLQRLNGKKMAEMTRAISNCEAVCRERLTAAAKEKASGFTAWEMVGIASGSVAAGIIIGTVIGFSAGL